MPTVLEAPNRAVWCLGGALTVLGPPARWWRWIGPGTLGCGRGFRCHGALGARLLLGGGV